MRVALGQMSTWILTKSGKKATDHPKDFGPLVGEALTKIRGSYVDEYAEMEEVSSSVEAQPKVDKSVINKSVKSVQSSTLPRKK